MTSAFLKSAQFEPLFSDFRSEIRAAVFQMNRSCRFAFQKSDFAVTRDDLSNVSFFQMHIPSIDHVVLEIYNHER